MKVKIGDFVRFVDEVGEGYVTSIIDDNLVGVTDVDGFEVPVLASKVTSVYGHNSSDEEVELKRSAIIEEGPFLAEGLSLALTGQQRQGIVKFYLINESSYEVLFNFGSYVSNQLRGEKHGILKSKSVERIYAANASKIGDWPRFSFQFLFYTPKALEVKKPLSLDKKIRPVDLSRIKDHVILLEERAWVFPLEEVKEDLNTDKLKERFISHRPTKRK